MTEPVHPAHQIKADDEENSNMSKKVAEIGPYWPKLAKNGQKWPKFNRIRPILKCPSN